MKCPRCQHENPPQAKFCLECGARFALACAQCGTQLPVGAKFCLECGKPTDSHGTEAARKLLDPVLEHMMEAVHRYEGTVNQVMGDGIMALFGAPLAHEDHAVRACYAALRMQAAVKRYAEDVRRAEGVAVQIRVGLNAGEVVVRSIGSDLRMDYTAVGQTTHLAARMEQLATPGSILMTTDVLRLAE